MFWSNGSTEDATYTATQSSHTLQQLEKHTEVSAAKPPDNRAASVSGCETPQLILHTPLHFNVYCIQYYSYNCPYIVFVPNLPICLSIYLSFVLSFWPLFCTEGFW